MVSLTIDGKKLEASEGDTVLEAATKAGIEIPHLCYHEGISPYGACRLCTVEITQDGRTQLRAACNCLVAAGMEVRTDSATVVKGRQIILELLLARCPDVKTIRQYAQRWGVRKTRFQTQQKDDCILCGLCVRACEEVIGAEALGFSGRGVTRQVDTTAFGIHPESCIGCGLCTYLCPTAKVQMEAKTANRLRQTVGTERTCRYMLMGLVSSKTCPENIECWQCPYDQLMELMAGTHPALLSPPAPSADALEIGPFTLRLDRSYAPNHTWTRSIGDLVMLGVDDFLCTLLGPVDNVDVTDDKVCLASRRRKVTLSLGVKGKLVKVNPDVQAVPRLVNYSPYDRGWLALLRPEGTWQSKLISGPDTSRWLREEVNRLKRMGGLPGKEARAPSTRLKWSVIRKAFFEKDK
jgi:glycine cleavage system H lipoate-binding protein/NAD-dependent dihydropyrimidine dehydrogenase PreA subunit